MAPPFKLPPSGWVSYAVAISICALALVCQLVIWPHIPPSPQLLFYPAVLIAAWFGGFGPGALAVVLSSLAMSYWFMPPTAGFAIESAEDALDLAIFIAMGLTVAALMATTREATRKARAAWAEAEAARARLAQAYRAREEMMAIVSHDLRSPLASIELSCSQIFRSISPSTDERVRVCGDRIQRAARRMEVLVRNLLDAATIEAGALQLRLASVQLNALLEGTIKLFEPLAERKSVRLGARLQAPPSLLCDSERIQQILENLVGNALKFVPPGGEVVVATRAEPDEVVFEVRDSGSGIPPDQIEHIFDRYWRGSGGAGSGLGLYIAKAIVEAHGGRIWATSDHGTTVAFALPLRTAETAAPRDLREEVTAPPP